MFLGCEKVGRSVGGVNEGDRNPKLTNHCRQPKTAVLSFIHFNEREKSAGLICQDGNISCRAITGVKHLCFMQVSEESNLLT